MKSVYYALFTMTLFASAAVAAPVVSAAAEPATAAKLGHEIRACIAELSKRANYEGATRVVHTVHTKQVNLAEREFRISTSVYADTEDAALRAYESRCVTRGPIKLVRFEFEAAG